MRKIVAGLFVSLDGVVEAPEQWHFPYFDDDMGRAVQEQMASAEDTLLGRKTYEGFASYWPNETGEMADRMNKSHKIVVSTTLTDPTWENTTVIGGDVKEGLTRLKEQPGGDIGMTGSVTLIRWLLREGLLDELRLLIHPIAVGHGQRLFDEGETMPLKLIHSEVFGSGVIYATYTRA